MVHVGMIQTHADKSSPENLQRTLLLAEKAVEKGAQIICTQELFASPYFCQTEDHENFKLAEEIPEGESTQAFQNFAKKHSVVCIASLFERRAAGLYHNTAIILDADGQLLGRYRKMHIPDDPLYYEKFYFTPGDTGFRAWNTRYGKVGVLICWDQWYPEAARLTALHGADILFYPTAIGWHPREKNLYGKAQHEAWQTIQRSHSIANGCYVVSVNRIGKEKSSEGEIEFWGQSFISSPMGEVIAKASPDTEEVIVTSLDLESVETTRSHWPFLRDRRIDAYSEINRRFID